MRRLLYFSIVLALAGNLPAAILPTDGSAADVQAKIDTANPGDSITLPPGSFVWTSGVTTSGKAVTLRGAGAARLLGRSLTPNTIGIGAKTFTTQPGLPLAPGQTVRLSKLGGEIAPGNGFATGAAPWMEGTVTNYAGTTLALEITRTNHHGTYRQWVIASRPATEVVNNLASGNLIALPESPAGHATLADLALVLGTGNAAMVGIHHGPGRPVLVHDCWIEVGNDSVHAFEVDTNSGVIWNCTVIAPALSAGPVGVHHKAPLLAVSAWSEPSYFGALDRDGTRNLYIEDCHFAAMLNATDFDDNARAVIRHSTLDHAAVGTHGADTGNPAIGVRHFEAYNLTFLYDNLGTESLMMNHQFYIRGGTFVICDCTMPAIDSGGYWGDKTEVNLTIQNLTRGDGSFGFWGVGQPGDQYPAPRQVGRGNPAGTATALDPLGLAIHGVSEPGHLWNNTGGFDLGFTEYDPTLPDSDRVAAYIVAGRDYHLSPKPGYVKFAYPHPLRSPTPPLTYATWRAAHFTGAELTDDAISGPLADPDGCGVTNLQRYAFALPARGPVTNPVNVDTADITAGRVLTLTFPRRSEASDLTYILESSPDLVTWTAVPDRTFSPGATPFTAEDVLPISGASRRFLRLRLTTTP